MNCLVPLCGCGWMNGLRYGHYFNFRFVGARDVWALGSAEVEVDALMGGWMY